MAAGSSTKKKTGTGKSSPSRKNSKSTGTRPSAGSGKNVKTAAGGRRNSAGSRTSSKSSEVSVKSSGGIGREVALCLILAFSVILLLANFGIVGRYGNLISGKLFGVFGLLQYVFPFAVFFGFAFFLANARNPLIIRKIFGFILMFVFLAAFLQLLTMGYSRQTELMEIERLSREERNGGGILGGAVIWVFGYAFGTVGAYVLTVCGLVAAAIIMTQRPLLTSLGRRSRNAAARAREKHQLNRMEREEQKKEQEAIEKLRRTEDMIEREQRIRDIEQEAARRERERNREKARSRSYSYREPMLNDEVNPLDAVTLDRPSPGNITPLSDESAMLPETREEKSAEKPRRKKEPKAAPPVPADEAPSFYPEPELKLAEPELPEEASAFEMPSFLKNSPETDSGVPEYSEETAYPEETEPDPLPVSVSDAEESADAAAEEIREVSLRTDKNEAVRAKKPKAEHTEDAGPPVSVDSIREEISKKSPDKPVYKLPPVELLSRGKAAKVDSEKTLMSTAQKLQQTLQDFGVNVKVVNVSRGPTVTRYELQPEHGVKVSRIVNLQDDIKLNLATSEIRIEAPIPGKAAVGIEVPNREIVPVMLREIVDCPEFQKSRATLCFAVGKDIGGKPVITDIEKMPHLLIAGATGSGKSVCINTLIMSILYKCTPDQVKMLMIDPKVVELKIYDGIPHLLIPVVTDAKKAAGALNWAVQEMTERYNKFASYPGVRDIRSYNARIEKMNAGLDEADRISKMPRIVVIVDELADLMMVASSEVEDAICRLAQLARAAGIHLIIATQRPSVNVVTGLIKANMPSRIALAVTSGIDSRTILDMNGAEKLLGKGDMLFYPQGYPKPARVQGAYVSDEDITEVVKFLTAQANETEYNKEVEDQISSSIKVYESTAPGGSDDDRDEYFAESGRLIIEKEKASIGMLQRAFKIGFNRAARIMDQLSDAGVVGGEEGTKPRKILMTMDEFENLLSEGS